MIYLNRAESPYFQEKVFFPNGFGGTKEVPMDAVLLSKIQFGFTAGFHFLFPPTTFGLTFLILILESLYRIFKGKIGSEGEAY